MAVYESLLQEIKIEPDPHLEVIRQLAVSGELEGFLFYEVCSRICPLAMLTLPEESRQLVERHIEKYIVVFPSS